MKKELSRELDEHIQSVKSYQEKLAEDVHNVRDQLKQAQDDNGIKFKVHVFRIKCNFEFLVLTRFFIGENFQKVGLTEVRKYCYLIF